MTQKLLQKYLETEELAISNAYNPERRIKLLNLFRLKQKAIKSNPKKFESNHFIKSITALKNHLLREKKTKEQEKGFPEEFDNFDVYINKLVELANSFNETEHYKEELVLREEIDTLKKIYWN